MREVEFELPGGLEIDGKVYKRGKIRGMEMKDEIEIAEDNRVRSNPAWQLPVTLVRCITQFEDLPVPVDINKIMKMKRRDYLYLANKIAEATDEGVKLNITCPHCGREHRIALADLLLQGGPLS